LSDADPKDDVDPGPGRNRRNGEACDPLTCVAPLAVLRNPFAGVSQDGLTELVEYGAKLGEQLAAEAISALGAPPVSYDKAAIVGTHRAAARLEDAQRARRELLALVLRHRCRVIEGRDLDAVAGRSIITTSPP